jgi:hypothetical protein
MAAPPQPARLARRLVPLGAGTGTSPPPGSRHLYSDAVGVIDGVREGRRTGRRRHRSSGPTHLPEEPTTDGLTNVLAGVEIAAHLDSQMGLG